MPNESAWYTDPKLMAKWMNPDVHPPEYKDAIIDYTLKAINKQLPFYYSPTYADVWDIVNPALERIWLGNVSAEEAIKDILPQVEAIYKW